MDQNAHFPTKKEISANPKETLVFMAIKRHENWETHEAYPSLDTIAKESGLSKPTVMKCIDQLVKKDYLVILDKGGKNKAAKYYINPYKNFEIISHELLDHQNLDPMEKGIVICVSEYMFKNKDDHTGVVTYDEAEICKNIGISIPVLKKYEKSLSNKGFLEITPTNYRNQKTGLPINQRTFKLDELGQAIVFAIDKHESRLNDHDKQYELLKEKYNKLEEEMNKIKDELRTK